MPFPPSIREEALVNSGRRCCVCHEFSGRSINIHHIIQEADGGLNTIDNAIALCLRCHSEAGHYNSHHPLGTKYSPTELIKHRDNWWLAVKSGKALPDYDLNIKWKRTHTSQDLHTHRIIASLQNGEYFLNEWKLQLIFPNLVPVRTEGFTDLGQISIDGFIYKNYQITGSKIFSSEQVELVGMADKYVEYDMNNDLYFNFLKHDLCFKWRFYPSSGISLNGSFNWREMHEF
ncbi:MAG: HNH endonuclease [Candidatus Competibacteraceae bacterium]|nr:HNH endonuclease [Candidatus Competibacteraceae bacterium]